MENIKEYTLDELKQRLKEAGFRPFTAVQIYKWIYEKGVEDFALMTDLAKPARAFLADKFFFSSLRLSARQTSSDKTEKYLFELKDKCRIETVMIPDKERVTFCLSTQVGCKFKCRFCASGLKGFTRNLQVSEIVGQFTEVNRLISPRRATNIVFMGIGEPLDNFANVVKAIRILRDPRGPALGRRRICLSTIGITPRIKDLASLHLGIKLSLSLHCADEKKRQQLMPGTKKYPLPSLIKEVSAFSRNDRFPLTFEYIMIRDVNSSPADALTLARLIKGIHAKVNLIAYNPCPVFPWQPPDAGQIAEFVRILKKHKITFTRRKPRGQDISASCGQLRIQAEK